MKCKRAQIRRKNGQPMIIHHTALHSSHVSPKNDIEKNTLKILKSITASKVTSKNVRKKFKINHSPKSDI